MSFLIFAKEGRFRSGGAFSQQRTIFAAHFTIAKWGYCAAKWHSCAKWVFHSCKTPCEMGLWLRKWDFLRFGDFAVISQLRNEVTVLRNGTRVPRGGFVTAKIFAEGGMGLRKSFRSRVAILQRRLDFAADLLGLRNHFAAKGRFCRGLLWATKFRRPILFPCF